VASAALLPPAWACYSGNTRCGDHRRRDAGAEPPLAVPGVYARLVLLSFL